MTDKEWLERATTFDLGTCVFYNMPIRIESRIQTDESVKWVLKMYEFVLGKDGLFHREPTPSYRFDEFIENTRFDSAEACHAFWVENVTEELQLYW